MNLVDYISSGVLELYASSMLSPEEMQEVERMCDQHPEVAAELLAIEDALAVQASVNYREPSPDLLAHIMDRIEEEEKKEEEKEEEKKEAEIRPLFTEKSSSRLRWWLAAASVILICSLVANFYLFKQLDQVETQLAILETENQSIAQQYEGMRTNYQVLTDPSFSTIHMGGQAASPESYASAVYDAASGKLFFNTGNLPETEADKQFQLWAIVEGVGPVSAGVFDKSSDLLQMPAIEGKVVAFAVTLEKRGGVESPTLEQMYVLGEV